ncbi:hypothetical protein GCK32_016046 [Trichostrongylus colubriformis]|uniref:Uncharacterized protein n=1 Tax=Trichostrongylus colubriformis TaxID=6319 RepID=A0AAN8FZQ1_TRICO
MKRFWNDNTFILVMADKSAQQNDKQVEKPCKEKTEKNSLPDAKGRSPSPSVPVKQSEKTGESAKAEGKDRSPTRIEPFHRAFKDSITLAQLREQLQRTLSKLNLKIDEGDALAVVGSALGPLIASWRKRDEYSERYSKGLLFILEYCLAHSMEDHQCFELLVTSLGYNTVQFWRVAVPHIFDSDLAYGTKFRDSLLFALTLYDVNTGKNRLRELYAAVPGIRKSLLGVNAKQFGERFHHLQKRLSRHSSMGSMESIASDKDDEGKRSRHSSNHSEEEDDDEPRVPTGGIANTHFQVTKVSVRCNGKVLQHFEQVRYIRK